MLSLVRSPTEIDQFDLDIPGSDPSLLWWTPHFRCSFIILLLAVAEYIAPLGAIGVTLGEHLLYRIRKERKAYCRPKSFLLDHIVGVFLQKNVLRL